MPDIEQDDDEDNNSGGLSDVPDVDEQYIRGYHINQQENK